VIQVFQQLAFVEKAAGAVDNRLARVSHLPHHIASAFGQHLGRIGQLEFCDATDSRTQHVKREQAEQRGSQRPRAIRTGSPVVSRRRRLLGRRRLTGGKPRGQRISAGQHTAAPLMAYSAAVELVL